MRSMPKGIGKVGPNQPQAIGAFFLSQKGASCPEHLQDIVEITRRDTALTTFKDFARLKSHG